jgi:hypothetical protein
MVKIFICKSTFKTLNQAYKVARQWCGSGAAVVRPRFGTISALKPSAPVSAFGADSFSDSAPIGVIWKEHEKMKKMSPI